LKLKSVRNMQPHVHWNREVTESFPDIAICMGVINNVNAEKENERIKKPRKAVYEEIRAKHNIETLKDNPTVRSYRDLDHTKITGQTRNVLIVGYGTPGIAHERLKEAVGITISYIKLVSNGETEMTKLFIPASK
jgi:DNA/RNA-binding domain of Phe-tRNA-synthetase-like protein